MDLFLVLPVGIDYCYCVWKCEMCVTKYLLYINVISLDNCSCMHVCSFSNIYRLRKHAFDGCANNIHTSVVMRVYKKFRFDGSSSICGAHFWVPCFGNWLALPQMCQMSNWINGDNMIITISSSARSRIWVNHNIHMYYSSSASPKSALYVSSFAPNFELRPSQQLQTTFSGIWQE